MNGWMDRWIDGSMDRSIFRTHDLKFDRFVHHADRSDFLISLSDDLISLSRNGLQREGERLTKSTPMVDMYVSLKVSSCTITRNDSISSKKREKGGKEERGRGGIKLQIAAKSMTFQLDCLLSAAT